MNNDDKRMEPEAFLDLVPQRQKGRLKIYIGAAAGVGKTYRMLEEAHQLRDRSVDVFLGFIETHRPPETEALIGALELLPPPNVPYLRIILHYLDLHPIIP